METVSSGMRLCYARPDSTDNRRTHPMNVAFYADYIADLRTLFTDLDSRPEGFQTFDVRLELAVAGGLVVYETKRRKGQTDSLFYGRPAVDSANQQMSRAAAFAAVDRFLALGQFVALTDASSETLDARYPHCAVNFSYRRKGQPAARSMLMVFAGFNDDGDARQFVSNATDQIAFVAERPHRAQKTYEWK
ncbi:hypothetical protein NN6n1_06030 [Shinella zoogloeoides]